MRLHLIAESIGVNDCATLHVGIACARVHKRIQFNNTIDCLGWREMKPRLIQIIKRVGETCTIAMCYAPVIIYVYSYVIVDSICNKTANKCDK